MRPGEELFRNSPVRTAHLRPARVPCRRTCSASQQAFLLGISPKDQSRQGDTCDNRLREPCVRRHRPDGPENRLRTRSCRTKKGLRAQRSQPWREGACPIGGPSSARPLCLHLIPLRGVAGTRSRTARRGACKTIWGRTKRPTPTAALLLSKHVVPSNSHVAVSDRRCTDQHATFTEHSPSADATPDDSWAAHHPPQASLQVHANTPVPLFQRHDTTRDAFPNPYGLRAATPRWAAQLPSFQSVRSDNAIVPSSDALTIGGRSVTVN